MPDIVKWESILQKTLRLGNAFGSWQGGVISSLTGFCNLVGLVHYLQTNQPTLVIPCSTSLVIDTENMEFQSIQYAAN